MGRTTSKRGTRDDKLRLCWKCCKRFGSAACGKRLCGRCCSFATTGRNPCAAHLPLRSVARRKQGSFLLVSSVNRLKEEQLRRHLTSDKRARTRPAHLAKRLKMEECGDDGEAEVVAQDPAFCGVSESPAFSTLVSLQAEEIARLRRELKQLRHDHERLKQKHLKVEQGLCIICEDRGLNVLLVPCGHCYCRDCVDGLPTCPVCHASIRRRHSYHPPAYVCDDAVLAVVPPSAPQPKASTTSLPAPPNRSDVIYVDDDEEEDYDEGGYSDDTAEDYYDDMEGYDEGEEYEHDEGADTDSDAYDSESSSSESTDAEFVLRRRSAANPHRVLFAS